MKTKILILALIYLLLLGSVFSAEKKEIANIDWRELFTEPSEIVYVIMKDGATFPCTSKHEVMVDMSIGRLEEKLRKVKGKNYSIKEITTARKRAFLVVIISNIGRSKVMGLMADFYFIVT